MFVINRKIFQKGLLHIYNKILLGHIKEWNLTSCDSTGGPGRYYAEWNKSVGGEQIPYDFTYL